MIEEIKFEIYLQPNNTWTHSLYLKGSLCGVPYEERIGAYMGLDAAHGARDAFKAGLRFGVRQSKILIQNMEKNLDN